MNDLELHPLCSLFPRMEAGEFEALKADIEANGQLQPIVVHDGMILDGGNRYRACIKLGIEPHAVEMDFEGYDLLSYVLSCNLLRRHLTPGQHAAIVSAATDWLEAAAQGDNRYTAVVPPDWEAAEVSGPTLPSLQESRGATLHLYSEDTTAESRGATLHVYPEETTAESRGATLHLYSDDTTAENTGATLHVAPEDAMKAATGAVRLRTVADRAAVAGVSIRTQKMADKVAKADPALIKQVAHGEISLPKAVQQVEGTASAADTGSDSLRANATEDSCAEEEPDDPYAEIERLHDQVATLQREIDSLSATDAGAEVLKLNQLLINEENKVKSFEVKMKALNLFGQRFADLRKILDVKYDRDVVGAVRKLVEASE